MADPVLSGTQPAHASETVEPSAPEAPVVVPQDAGVNAEQRQELAELPLAPVDGAQQVDGDAVMAEAEAVAKEESDDGGDGDAMEDLFGDDGDEEAQKEDPQDITMADEAAGQAEGQANEAEEPLSAAELERRRRLEYEEGDEEQPAIIEEKVQYAAVKLPKIPMANANDKLWHAKMPNFLHLETHAFDPETYDPSNEPANIPSENVIRWRWDPASLKTQPKKQSNARFIRWNDGSMSVQVGSEIFDIATDRGTSGKSVPPASTTSNVAPSDPTTYLVAQHGYAGLMEAQAGIGGVMTFRPSAIQSTSHRKLAAINKQGAQKSNKVVMVMASADPEAEQRAREQALKGSRRPRQPREGGAAGGKKGKRKSVRSTRLDDFSDDEPDDMDEAESRALAASRKRDRQREAEEMEDFLASETDEDDEGGSGRRSRRDADADDEDDMDALDAGAERADRERRKGSGIKAQNRREPSPDSEDVDKDDVGFTRKKLVVESDEE